MMDATSSAISTPTLRASVVANTHGRWPRCIDDASVGTHGVEPTTPKINASQSSEVRYQLTVYGVVCTGRAPNNALRNPAAEVRVAARKKTQPIITTANVYACGQIGHARGPAPGSRRTGTLCASRSSTRN